MMKRRCLILLLTMLMVSAEALACTCIIGPVIFQYQRYQFVAKAKILKVTPDPSNADYHDAEIELIALYKGERPTKIKIASEMKTSCEFLPDENSTWIVFAMVKDGVATFGLCSGSFQTDQKPDPWLNPDAAKNHAQSILLKQETLEFIKDRPLDPNPHGLWISNAPLESISGYRNKNSFAVFQVEVDTDLSITSIKALKKFQNGRLNRAVLEKIKTNATFSARKSKPTKPVQITIFCYYYEGDGADKSFVSIRDV